MLRHLLPLAYQGLTDWGVAASVRDRYLAVIEGRCKSGVNGAVWQSRRVRDLEEAGADRPTALKRMLAEYTANMHTNDPVHTWPL